MTRHNDTLGRTQFSRAVGTSEINEISCGKECSSPFDNINVTQNNSGCGGNINSTFGLSGYPLASVYAPLQDFDEVYDCETGLTRGTIFPGLDLPFICGGMNGGVGRG